MKGWLIRKGTWRAQSALFLFLWLLLPLAGGQADAAVEMVSRTTVVVEHITCGACLRVIDAELRKVPGILGMAADLPARLVTVDHDPELPPAEVAAAITAAGYPAKVVESLASPRSQTKLFQRGPGFCSGPGGCNPGGTNPVADAWRELRRRFKGERGCEPRPGHQS